MSPIAYVKKPRKSREITRDEFLEALELHGVELVTPEFGPEQMVCTRHGETRQVGVVFIPTTMQTCYRDSLARAIRTFYPQRIGA